MRVICGIGNPGAQYAMTRHNAGFMIVDMLATRYGLSFEKHKKWQAQVAEWRLPAELGEGRALLLKPQTYVNESGRSLQPCMTFHKVLPAEVLVAVDDIHLPLASLRLRVNGSAGGHNGLKDIEARIGREYPRLRFGIGAPGIDQIGHVLGAFSTDERDDLQAGLSKACDCVERWLAEGPEAAMRFNGPLHPPQPQPKPAKPSATEGDAADNQGDDIPGS